MLELRPICENCGKDLPNDSNEAMMCTFECTYCADCVTNVLHNVCPNCGGGGLGRSRLGRGRRSTFQQTSSRPVRRRGAANGAVSRRKEHRGRGS